MSRCAVRASGEDSGKEEEEEDGEQACSADGTTLSLAEERWMGMPTSGETHEMKVNRARDLDQQMYASVAENKLRARYGTEESSVGGGSVVIDRR